jgi:hypothetical protein
VLPRTRRRYEDESCGGETCPFTVQRADAPVVDGALNGLGTYFDEAFPATIAGTFRNGGLDGPALLTDRCGNVYRMRVERNGALVNVARSGEREYLSHACDAFAPGPGGLVGRNGRRARNVQKRFAAGPRGAPVSGRTPLQRRDRPRRNRSVMKKPAATDRCGFPHPIATERDRT